MELLTEQTVRAAVFGAVADLNESLPAGRRIPLDGSTDVFSHVDSLGTLNLMLRIEQRVSDATGAECDLMGTDVYETTIFKSPTLDGLVLGVLRALDGAVH